MLVPSPRPGRLVDSLALAVLALASLALVGCKQDIGQRCEQGSDCSSGYCGDSPLGMVSVMGRVCTPPPTAGPISDAGAAADATDAPTPAEDAASDAGSDDASDAGSDDASDAAGGEASPHDGGADVLEAGAEAGAETSLGDVMTEAGAGG
ncbi:MAG TPA: hypothetical protein VMT47_02490 [Polyangia bacterium]|nr:hypothetical protein [Polyangia bacterium]